MGKLVKVYRYREKRVHGARFPESHPFIAGLRSLIPHYERDNHQLAIFDVGETMWGSDCRIAVYFSDCVAYVGHEHEITDGD